MGVNLWIVLLSVILMGGSAFYYGRFLDINNWSKFAGVFLTGLLGMVLFNVESWTWLYARGVTKSNDDPSMAYVVSVLLCFLFVWVIAWVSALDKKRREDMYLD